jgi:hypothetical protein
MGFVFASADSTAPPSAPQPTPQLATLQGAHLPMSEALKTLTAQTSNPVADLMGAPDPFVDVDLQKVPFWDALDALADKAGGRVDLHSRDGIALVPRPPGWHPPPVSRDGLFRTALSSLTSRLDLESDTRTCIASVEVAWEPRLLPLLLETRPRSLRVVDDAGRSIPSGAVTSSLAPVDGRDSLSFDLALPAVSRAVKTLSLAQGDFYAIAPTKMLAFSFGPLDQLRSAGPDNPLVRSTQEGVVCRVSKVTAADDHWSVQITLDYPEGNVKLDSYQSWVVNNEIRLEDEAGDRFLSDTYLLEESTAEHAVLTYHFNDKERVKRGLSAWKVVYRTPALVVKVPIRFAFKDVPLP